MRIGEKKTFRPAAFLDERGPEPEGKLIVPRMVTGVVTWVHPAGRYYVVTYEVNGHRLREAFSRSE